MIAIVLGQMIMSFNVASLPVALSGMVESFSVPPTTIATGIVAYGMLVAGFVMLGAKLTQRYGATRMFRAAVGMFCASQVLMTFSPTATLMITAQALCGAAAAVIVPALVALIAEQYTGRQQETAVGALGSARAAAGVLAFVVGGILGTYIGWRPAFGILIAASAKMGLLIMAGLALLTIIPAGRLPGARGSPLKTPLSQWTTAMIPSVTISKAPAVSNMRNAFACSVSVLRMTTSTDRAANGDSYFQSAPKLRRRRKSPSVARRSRRTGTSETRA
jgi:MFS family permease